MNNRSFLIPANAKRGLLIFSFFRPFDLMLFGTGMLISILLLVIVSSNSTIALICSCLPGALVSLLVFPIPNYHNVMEALISVIEFYGNRRQYKWKGWCMYEQFIQDDKKN